MRLANLFQSYLDEEFRRHPLFATQQGNHEYDDRLDDLSVAARTKDVATTRAMLATLAKEIDFGSSRGTGRSTSRSGRTP